MFDTELFRKQIYSIEESACDIFGIFRRTRSDSTPSVVILQKQSSKHPKLKLETLLNQWSFCQFLECQAPPAKTQSPPIENFLATVLSLLKCLILGEQQYFV